MSLVHQKVEKEPNIKRWLV